MIRFDLHADSPHDNVNIVTIDVDIVSPQCFDDGFPVVHDALMEYKEFQNLEFQGSDRNVLVKDSYLAGVPVYFQALNRNDLFAGNDAELNFAFCTEVIAVR
jgi:hypothetical protein